MIIIPIYSLKIDDFIPYLPNIYNYILNNIQI